MKNNNNQHLIQFLAAQKNMGSSLHENTLEMLQASCNQETLKGVSEFRKLGFSQQFRLATIFVVLKMVKLELTSVMLFSKH